MIKKAKEKANGKRSEEHRIGVMLEHMDSKLDLLAEGHQMLEQKIDRKVDELRGEMNQQFGIVFDELHLIRNDLKEKVSRDEFIVLEKRVAMIEKKLHSQ